MSFKAGAGCQRAGMAKKPTGSPTVLCYSTSRLQGVRVMWKEREKIFGIKLDYRRNIELIFSTLNTSIE
jgi:hypothetical protein